MRVLIALNHPAHYYLFKFIKKGLEEKSYEVSFVIKEKDVLEKILISEQQEYIKINEKKQRKNNPFSVISKGAIELITQDFRLLRYVREFKPDYMLGTDISIAHIGKLLKIPSFIFNEDDFEINKLFCKATYPFASYIIAPEYTSVGKYINKKIAYNGIQKMAYLNTKYFDPDENILSELGLSKTDTFYIIRLVSLTSGHDIEGQHKGIDISFLNRIVPYLEKTGRVFITSEDKLTEDLVKYQVKIAPNKMQDLMYFSSLFIGDSQTMCAEAGILGTPFIRFNDFVGKIEYLNDLENNYKLGWGVKTDNPERVFSIIGKLVEIPSIKKEWSSKKDKLFADKVDLTALTVWIIDNFPISIQLLKENPDFQYKFR